VVLVFFLLIFVFSYAFFSSRSQVFGKVYSQFPQNDKAIALTFDDGPNGSYTQRILDILVQEKVRATFFVIGKNVEYYPALTRKIVENGNVLANHSYSHSRIAPLEVSYKEEDRAEEAIFKVTGLRPRFFRPPFGEKTPWMLSEIEKEGLVVFSWNDEANDPHLKDPEEIAKRIISQAHPGGIILLHDGFETKHEGNREPTVQALPKIIDGLRTKGYHFVTLDEFSHSNPYF
jgi:peptidoglycan/xylan/chitin deacetylase (PgdA/CDA1 family)